MEDPRSNYRLQNKVSPPPRRAVPDDTQRGRREHNSEQSTKNPPSEGLRDDRISSHEIQWVVGAACMRCELRARVVVCILKEWSETSLATAVGRGAPSGVHSHTYLSTTTHTFNWLQAGSGKSHLKSSGSRDWGRDVSLLGNGATEGRAE